MVAAPKLFTIEEANALLPELSSLVSRQILLHAEIDEQASELSKMTGENPPSLEPKEADSSEVRARKTELLERVAAYEEGFRKIAATGAIVKDARRGLIDFYGKVDGRAVWLCWRYGETQIDWYHEIDAGFSGRKRLDASIRRTLLN